jgi:hypothetical protein
VLLDLIAKGNFSANKEKFVKAVISDLSLILEKPTYAPSLDTELIDCMRCSGSRVAAVKLCRELMGWNIKYAVEYVSELAEKNGITFK